MSDTFIDEVLEGAALWTDVERWVGDWHAGNGEGRELREYLGMTWPEYQLWVERPAALRMIIAAREHELPVETFVADFDEMAVAARGLSSADVHLVERWLKETGRLPA
ncbi:MAG TPA: hypothetical protein VK756_11025 [Solirubrobacteraceae bacterium]|jgi:hypothetical protein|nr:hypothetical protein [Solirubrobacteraceae bacterium]